jgi:hypothetical protein
MISRLAAGNNEARDERLIADLSRAFCVPSKEVQEIYREQLRRLAEGARICGFLGVLAMRRTRSILRDAAGLPRTNWHRREARRRRISSIDGYINRGTLAWQR